MYLYIVKYFTIECQGKITCFEIIPDLNEMCYILDISLYFRCIFIYYYIVVQKIFVC